MLNVWSLYLDVEEIALFSNSSMMSPAFTTPVIVPWSGSVEDAPTTEKDEDKTVKSSDDRVKVVSDDKGKSAKPSDDKAKTESDNKGKSADKKKETKKK